jgi:hypothetical protein
MKNMFSSMMERFTKGMSEEDKQKMMECGQKMVAICPCLPGKKTSGEEKRVMAEQMMACCGGMKEMMSGFFKRTGSQPEGAEKPEKA